MTRRNSVVPREAMSSRHVKFNNVLSDFAARSGFNLVQSYLPPRDMLPRFAMPLDVIQSGHVSRNSCRRVKTRVVRSHAILPLGQVQ